MTTPRPPEPLGRLLAGETGDKLLDRLPNLAHALDRRVNADEHDLEKGLAQLVLTVVELLRQLMERQALRRVESGTLDDEQVERLGRALMALEQKMAELRETFGLKEEDLNLDLGPLGRLL
jgi:gas vesicle protein GvpK